MMRFCSLIVHLGGGANVSNFIQGIPCRCTGWYQSQLDF
jgi:hypothetical protein